MLRPGKYFFLLLVFLSIKATPQVVHSVYVEGKFNINKVDIITWSGVEAGMKLYPEIIDSVKYRMASHLARMGYLHSSFDGTEIIRYDTGSVNLIIKLDQGTPTYINSINISGLDSTQKIHINTYFEYLKGEIFNKSELENDIEQALTYFENNGYPFAKIEIPSIYFYDDSLSGSYYADISLNCKPGILSRIDRFEIIGNLKTQDYVILRELRIMKGEIYSQKIIDELPKRLNLLGYFEPVEQPEFFLNSKNEGTLRIKVKEKETNNFDGVIGFIPATNNGQSGYLTGLVNVSLRNLFGTGRAAAINWQQYDRYSQNLEIKYLEPWFLGYPFNVLGSLFQRKQDSTYVQRKIEGSIEYLATETISASFNLSTESVIPTQNNSSVFTVYNSSAVTTGLNLKIDTRNDPYAPTEGVLFQNSYSYSKKKITGPANYITPGMQTNISLQRIALDISAFYQVFSRQIIAASFHGRELRGSFFEVSDLYRLGGANTLRGYREDQFLGNRIFWTNLEYRFLLTRRTFGFLFLDTGYYLRNADAALNIEKNEGFNIGYGLGVNLETSLGVLRVSFALAKGDSFSDAKIHFGIVNEF